MQFVIAFALLAIAVVLFYRFVERPHKMVVGKTLLGTAAVLGILGLAAYAFERRREAREAAQFVREWEERARKSLTVTVTYLGDSVRKQTYNLCRYSSDPNCKPTIDSSTRVLTFRLCNSGKDTVYSTAFTPVTFASGRSTEYAVVRPAEAATKGQVSLFSESESPGDLKSDHIIPPGKCATGRWEGNYTVEDSVFVRVGNVVTARSQMWEAVRVR